jgi:NADH-quinone oxidoreductase subunit L
VPLAALSLGVAVIGIGVAAGYYFRDLGPHGLTRRNGLARAGYSLLDNKYYLDKLYIDVIIRSIQYQLARAIYWFDQHIIDGFVNGIAAVSKVAARFTYDVVDQKVVDGVANGAGFTAEESGGLLRYIQTGRVQQYAAVLFAAVGIFALVLVLTV